MVGKILINGIIEDLSDAVMQRAFIGSADIHARFLANGLQALEFSQLRGSVKGRSFGRDTGFFVGFEHVFLRHKNWFGGRFWPSTDVAKILGKKTAKDNNNFG